MFVRVTSALSTRSAFSSSPVERYSVSLSVVFSLIVFAEVPLVTSPLPPKPLPAFMFFTTTEAAVPSSFSVTASTLPTAISSMVPSLLPCRNSTEIFVSSVTVNVMLLPEASNVLPPIPPGALPASPSGLSGAPLPDWSGASPELSPSGFAGGSPSGLSEPSAFPSEGFSGAPDPSPEPLPSESSPGFSGAEPSPG